MYVYTQVYEKFLYRFVLKAHGKCRIRIKHSNLSYNHYILCTMQIYFVSALFVSLLVPNSFKANSILVSNSFKANGKARKQSRVYRKEDTLGKG